MISRYTKVGAGTALSVVALLGLASELGRGSVTKSIWGDGGAPEWLIFIILLLYFTSFVTFAKALGRSGWLGLALGFTGIVGIIWMFFLEDRSDRLHMIKCRECLQLNEPELVTCRTCLAPLAIRSPRE